MFKFKKEQVVYDIQGIKVGGQPGENPTVLISSMFYSGHKIVVNRKKGEFDRGRAEELIKKQEEISDETGLPHMIDVVGVHPGEICRYIDFVSEVTDVPILIDAWKLPPKLAAARHVKEIGLADRTIYNSIAPWSEDIQKELNELKKIGLKTALIVAYNQNDLRPIGRLKILKEHLLKDALDAGFKQTLIDTSVMNLPSIGFSNLACKIIKEELGIPAGSGPSNGMDMWNKSKEWDKNAFIGVDAAVHAISAVLWNDFVLIGAIENAKWLFPAVAAADCISATIAYDYEIKISENHPVYMHFPKFIQEIASMLFPS
jgi:tetrahydromethanopterin S-methyltransferase subunit H